MSVLRGARGLALVFLVLSLVKVARHETWRDEIEYWDSARTSQSVQELRAETRYLGQPPLWSLLLFGVTRLTHDPRAMQVLNVLIVTLGVFVFASHAPFSWAVKWLFALGYFPFFEYGTISRPYGLGLLALFGACAAFTAQPRRHGWLAASLALLALSHFHGTLVVIAVLLAAAVLHVLERRAPGATTLGVGAVAAIAAAASIGLSIPPADSYFQPSIDFSVDAGRFVTATAHVFYGLAPWPPFVVSFWNRNLLDALPLLAAALGALLLAAFSWSLRRERGACLVFLGGTGGLWLFSYAVRAGQVRHDGTYFLVLMAALWLARAGATGPAPSATRLAIGILLVNLVAGVFASVQDLRLPFSQSVAVAEALRAPEYDGLPIVGDVDFAAAAVAARLERPIYLMSQGRMGTHVEWSGERRAVSRPDVARVVERLQAESGRDVLLLLNYVWDGPAVVEPLGCFEGAIVANETYCLYRARRATAEAYSASRP